MSRHKQALGALLKGLLCMDAKVLLGAVSDVHRHMHGHQPGQLLADRSELVEAEQTRNRPDDHWVRDADAVRESRDPLGLVDAHFSPKVGPVQPNGSGRGSRQAVANHQHGNRDRIQLEVSDVHEGQLADREALEEDHIAHKHAVAEAVTAVEVGHVHAIVNERGGNEEKVAPRQKVGVNQGDGCDIDQVGKADVLLGEEHALGTAQDDP
eukprot:scaffold199852_cov40-Prasinocladus_malaysianus.AAC.1